MVKAQAVWSDGERFLVQATSGHAFVVDADRTRNSAPGPMELVLIGLCTCTATDVVTILRKKRESSLGSRYAQRRNGPKSRPPSMSRSSWFTR